MKRVLHLLHESDLYEITHEGTKVLNIQHFEQNSTTSRTVQFPNLPPTIRKQLIYKLRNQKGEALPALLLFIIGGILVWFIVIKVGLKIYHNNL